MTVSNDLSSGVQNFTPEAREVYGRDGKTCTVPREVRPRAIEQMRRERLTQQQIADKLNVSQFTVSKDLRGTNIDINNGLPATITNSRGQERPATYAKPAPAVNNVVPLPGPMESYGCR